MTYQTGLRVEKKGASPFQPDILLPAQYLETFRRKANLEPEKELMLAVLEDAIACFQKYISARDGRRKTVFQDAKEWILEENNDWLFSFENICEVLGFSPQYVRQGIVQRKKTNLRLTAKAHKRNYSTKSWGSEGEPPESESPQGQNLAAGR